MNRNQTECKDIRLCKFFEVESIGDGIQLRGVPRLIQSRQALLAPNRAGAEVVQHAIELSVPVFKLIYQEVFGLDVSMSDAYRSSIKATK